MHFNTFSRRARPAPREPRAYDRYDLVRCEDCTKVFLAQGRRVWCPGCASERLHALRPSTALRA